MDEPTLSEPSDDHANRLLVAEYSGLRDEITKRIEIQHQVITLTLLVAGVFLGLGTDPTSSVSSVALLLYPILALFLAAAWAHNGVRIVQIGGYLQQIEKQMPAGFGWQLYRKGRSLHQAVLNILAARGIFLGTQLLAVVLGLLRGSPQPLAISLWHGIIERAAPSVSDLVFVSLLILDALAVALTYYVVRSRDEQATRSY